MKLTAQLTGDKAAIAQLQRLAGTGQQALDRTAEEVDDLVRQFMAPHVKGPALNASLQMRRIAGGWLIENDLQIAPHAKFVHWGTRPHVIRGKPVPEHRVYPKPPNKVFGGIFRPWYTKTRKTLRFVVGNRYVFADHVDHPGYRGDAWMVRAAALAPQIFAKHVQAVLAQQSTTTAGA